jgi:hypothetical protein
VGARTVPVLNREELLKRLDAVFFPKPGQFTEAQIDEMLLEFCMNCPDPAAAMDAVVETEERVTTEGLLDRLLSMPPRSPASYSRDELSPDHPLRHWHVQLRAV